jgi:hypothetical protein
VGERHATISRNHIKPSLHLSTYPTPMSATPSETSQEQEVQSPNTNYAIVQTMKKMSAMDCCALFFLTKQIIEFQERTQIRLLNTSDPQVTILLTAFPEVEIRESDYNQLAHIYRYVDIFDMVKGLMKKTKHMKVSKTVKEYVDGAEEQDKITEFFNRIALVNLIKQRLLSKSHQELADYGLLNKIREIGAGLVEKLSLTPLANHETNIRRYIDATYSYKELNLNTLAHATGVDFEAYHRLMDLFGLFR